MSVTEGAASKRGRPPPAVGPLRAFGPFSVVRPSDAGKHGFCRTAQKPVVMFSTRKMSDAGPDVSREADDSG